mmetsp:Transcript_14009/g.19445  ORF Transcript_14009/g.19445 Transcript_14009/m.19445 type:complete len:90 (-) Transcript_14009:297-566(-)
MRNKKKLTEAKKSLKHLIGIITNAGNKMMKALNVKKALSQQIETKLEYETPEIKDEHKIVEHAKDAVKRESKIYLQSFSLLHGCEPPNA